MVSQNTAHAVGGEFFEIIVFLGRHQHLDICLLMGAVGVKERPGDIYDRSSPPVEDKAGFFGHDCHRCGFEVLLGRIGKELILVFRRDDDRHSLLGFGDRKFCAVKAFVFLGHEVKVDVQSVREFADRDGNAARAEVIALFNEA